jgi:hypothetical protein
MEAPASDPNNDPGNDPSELTAEQMRHVAGGQNGAGSGPPG